MSNLVEHSIIIKKYDGDLDVVSKLNRLIESDYSMLFHSVIVHGSVATNEVIPYSDFDGLLIVKDAFVNSKQLKEFKRVSMKLILEFDPLQHHGWFQIKESELQNYPQYYLPYEILEHSKLMFPQVTELSLDLKIDFNAVDYKRSLKQLMTSIQIQSEMDISKMRLYDFKSYISKIMLLPSMYFSAKHQKGIFKKFSFDEVKKDFNADAWFCIEMASELRQDWNYNLSKFQLLIMTMPFRPCRQLTKRYISPKVEYNLQSKIDHKFYKSLEVLINTINKDIFVA